MGTFYELKQIKIEVESRGHPTTFIVDLLSFKERLSSGFQLCSSTQLLHNFLLCSVKSSLDVFFCSLFAMALPQHASFDSDRVKKEQGPHASSHRSYKLPIMFLCAIFGYGICQLDLTLGTVPSSMPRTSFTTSNYLKNGKIGAKRPILQITVLGERNSGTRWTWG